MKQALIFAGLLLAGCGAVSNNTAPLAWAGDGNPTVPVCGAALINCKLGYELMDFTTGAITVLPITAKSATVLKGHAYGLRVTGYNGQGVQIYSAYAR